MRLPVILVQNPPAVGAALAEALVGNLIGRAGLDLTLVDRFDSLSSDSTDRMTLDGITVPSAILDWRTPEEMLVALSSIGFTGVRAAHELDSGTQGETGGSQRRLFLFDLTKHKDAMTIVAELDRLRKSLSVKTFSLGSIGTKSDDTPVAEAGKVEIKLAKDVEPAGDSIRSKESISAVAEASVTRSDEHLDALIDQLDELDV